MMKLNKHSLIVGLYKAWCFIEYYAKQIISIALIVVALVAMRGCIEKNNELQDFKSTSVFNDSLSESKVTDWKDKYNNEHSRVQNLVVNKELLSKKLDSISSVLNIKSKQVVAINKTGETITINGKLKVDTFYSSAPLYDNGEPCNTDYHNIDSLKFSWYDAWMKVNGVLGKNKDSIFITGTDTLKRTDYWKRKGLFGKKIYYSDFNNSNPHITVTGYNGLIIGQKEKNWSVNINASIGYSLNNLNIHKPTLFVGVGVGKTLFRF